MTTLTIRRLDPELHRRLRVRAARNGRSMEAELRAILAEVLAEEPDIPRDPHAVAAELQAFVDRLYGPDKPTGVVDALIAERRAEAEREEREARAAQER